MVVEELRARVASLADRNQQLKEVSRWLEHLVRKLRRAIYRKKSEKLHTDQTLRVLEEFEDALADVDAVCQATDRGAQHRSSAGSPA